MRTFRIAVAVVGVFGLGAASTRILTAEDVKISFDKPVAVTRLTTADLGLAQDWSQMRSAFSEYRTIDQKAPSVINGYSHT